MIALQYPFQVDSNGSIRTTQEYSQIVRGQMIDVLMTNWNERVMRPAYGSNAQAMLFDPTEELQKMDAAQQIANRISRWTSRAHLQTCEYSFDGLNNGRVFLDVTYKPGLLAPLTTIRTPVSAFLSAEELV